MTDIVVRYLSASLSESSQATYFPENTALACVNITPLGRDVVPEVYMISNRSPGLTSGLGGSVPARSAFIAS